MHRAMRPAAATIATPGRRNEDRFAIGADWAFVLDGATAPSGVDSGCAHDVVWLVHTLGSALEELLTVSGAALPEVLAEAIERLCAAHADTCDLGNPDSPSSTVAMVRIREPLEYLVLADSPVLLEAGGEVRAVVDDRLDRLPSYTRESVRELRNRPGGFWVASTRPEAAEQAVCGSVREASRVALLSDGASRFVDRFGLSDWAGLLDLVEREGPEELLRRVRAAEAAETEEQRRRLRGKAHDDATVVFVRRKPSE